MQGAAYLSELSPPAAEHLYGGHLSLVGTSTWRAPAQAYELLTTIPQATSQQQQAQRGFNSDQAVLAVAFA